MKYCIPTEKAHNKLYIMEHVIKENCTIYTLNREGLWELHPPIQGVTSHMRKVTFSVSQTSLLALESRDLMNYCSQGYTFEPLCGLYGAYCCLLQFSNEVGPIYSIGHDVVQQNSRHLADSQPAEQTLYQDDISEYISREKGGMSHKMKCSYFQAL